MKRALALVLCCCALAVGCSKRSTSPAATVNGVQLSTQEVVDELDAINANKDYLSDLNNQFTQAGQAVVGATPGSYDAAFVAAVIRRQMQFALIHSEVEKRGLQASDECKQAAKNDLLLSLGQNVAQKGQAFFDSFPAAYQNRLRGWYEDEFMLQADLSGQPCGGADVAKAYFDSHQPDFTQSCISLIAINDENAANSIVAQVRGGADFAPLAMQFSTDAQTAAVGGDAGCHLPSEFPSTVAPIVQATAVGQVADPISNNGGGFVIIKVSDRKPAVFTDVAAQAEELAARDQSVQFNAWLNTAQGSADVSVDPRYGTFDPATFTIKPPPIDSNAPSSGSNTVPTSAPPAVSSTASTTPP